ncbi:MAG: hypothetical protein H0U77_09160 [Nocardioidaceae bacterium]|nr:hypothetical protein [Nocardioidaceae bacterium]
MTRVRTLAVASLLPLLALPLTTAPAAGDDSSGDDPAKGVSRAASLAVLRAGTMVGSSFVPAPKAVPERAQAATINVSYSGFSQSARAAFQRAVNTWEPLLASSVPITVDATFQPSSPGNLGSAGPSFIWRDFRNAPQPNTWYVDAIANKRAGRQLDPAADIIANFNSSRSDWYFGTGAPPNNRYDFESVVLHELGHGLGFLGLATVSSGQGSIRVSGFPSGYDRFTENGGGTRLTTFADPSTQLANQLTSNSVFFDSPKVRNANGGKTARLYAPASWQQGSSYSHLNETTYGPGNRNSLMTPFLNDAEAIRTPGPIVRAVFGSTGW